jgi:hypothetical protein
LAIRTRKRGRAFWTITARKSREQAMADFKARWLA